MTDEQIEKALSSCASGYEEECLICPYHEHCSAYNTLPFAKDLLDYKNRLKEKIYQLEQNLGQCENGYKLELVAVNTDNALLRNENEFLKEKCDILERKVKKQDSKKILQQLLSFIGSNQKFCIVDEEHKTLIDADDLFKFIGKLTKKYGVEIDND